jgi:RNA polymerase sigma factor (TIGR02999 family)
MNKPAIDAHRWTKSAPLVAEDVLPLVYEDLRKLAAARMSHEKEGQTLQATALVHEAWLWLMRSGQPAWENRAHFFSAAEQAMRRVLIQNARRKARLKRWGGQDRVEMDEWDLADTTPEDKALLIHEALEGFRKEDPQKAKIVELKFFGGLTSQEVAEQLGVTERTVERHWAYAKAWLFQAIKKEL